MSFRQKRTAKKQQEGIAKKTQKLIRFCNVSVLEPSKIVAPCVGMVTISRTCLKNVAKFRVLLCSYILPKNPVFLVGIKNA